MLKQKFDIVNFHFNNPNTPIIFAPMCILPEGKANILESLEDFHEGALISGITVNIKPSAADKVRTSVVGGRRCLLIDLDDPTIEINGLPVRLEEKANDAETVTVG
jgi:hypothetical protein